jgi:hypothetical protein
MNIYKFLQVSAEYFPHKMPPSFFSIKLRYNLHLKMLQIWRILHNFKFFTIKFEDYGTRFKALRGVYTMKKIALTYYRRKRFYRDALFSKQLTLVINLVGGPYPKFGRGAISKKETITFYVSLLYLSTPDRFLVITLMVLRLHWSRPLHGRWTCAYCRTFYSFLLLSFMLRLNKLECLYLRRM